MTLKQSSMSWSRFLGLIQTDGNFTFTVDKDRTIRPKVTLTITKKRKAFIETVIQFLKLNGIRVSSSNYNNDNFERGFNISIERIGNCSLLISKLEALQQGPTPISLVGGKNKAYVLFKEVLRLCKEPRTEAIKLQLIDLKSKLREINAVTVAQQRWVPNGTESLATNKEENFISKLGLSKDIKWKGAAAAIYKTIENKAEASTQLMVDNSKRFKGCQNIPREYAEFISGVWEGDGSFQVSIKTHQTSDKNRVVVKKGNTSWKRRLIEINPEITLTDLKTEDANPLFTICNNLFYPEITVKTSMVEKDNQGRRVYFKSKAAIAKYVIPFFELYPPSSLRAFNRFKIMRLVSKYNDKILTSARHSRCVINLLFNSPDFDTSVRPLTREQYFELIEKQFKKL